jgi:hypothetical protein
MKLTTNIFGAIWSVVIGTVGTTISSTSDMNSPSDYFGMALVGIALILFIGVMKDL